MLLKRVKIQNYRQFRDVELEFSDNLEKNINVILGNSASGKTSFINALNWCLYGSEINNNSALEICNNKTKNQASIGDIIEVNVELEFIVEEDIFVFNRVLGFKKTSKGLTRDSSFDNFELNIASGDDIKIHNSPYYFLEKYIPKELEDYIFFNPSILYVNYNKGNERLKSALYNYFQLNLLENIVKNMDRMKKSYIKKQKKIYPKIGKWNEEIAKTEDKIKSLKKSLDSLEKESQEINLQIEEIDIKLTGNNPSDIKQIYSRNKELERLILLNQKKLNQLEEEHERYVLLNYPYIMSYNSFVAFVDLCDGYLPKDIPKSVISLINNLSKEGKDIQEVNLVLNEEHRKLLEDWFDGSIEALNYHDELISALEQIRNVIIEKILEFKNTSLNYHKEIMDLKNNLNKCISEKKEIESMLFNTDSDEVRKLIQIRDNLLRTRDNIILKIKGNESKISYLEKHLVSSRKKLTEDEKNILEFDEYNNKIYFCDKIIKSTEDIYHSLQIDIIDKLKKLTEENLKILNWRMNDSFNLMIDNNLELSIINSFGECEKPYDLSDGERLILHISFLAAIHKLLGNFPIVLDNPLRNLDFEMKRNIMEKLPEIFHNQAILLLHESDYLEYYGDAIYDYVASENVFFIDNSEEGKESKVI